MKKLRDMRASDIDNGTDMSESLRAEFGALAIMKMRKTNRAVPLKKKRWRKSNSSRNLSKSIFAGLCDLSRRTRPFA
jgi:hypothetical protein